MPRKPSWVWEYATQSKDGHDAICKICNEEFSYDGSPSAIGRHLVNIHSVRRTKKEHEVIERMDIPVNGSNEGNNTEGTNNNASMISTDDSSRSLSQNDFGVDASIPSTPITCSTLGSSVSHSEPSARKRPRRRKLTFDGDMESYSKKRQEEVSAAIAQLIASCQLPISLVDTQGFRNFMKILEPQFTVPVSKTILHRLNLTYALLYDKISERLKKVSSVACTTDCWSSIAQESFMSLTVHYFDENWEIKNHTLCSIGMEERHYSENLAIALETLFAEWELEEKLAATVHDCASDISLGVTMVNKGENVLCAAHKINLCVNDVLGSEDFVRSIKRGRAIVNYFKSSNLAKSELTRRQKENNLPENVLLQSCPTRWGSTFLMCERLVQNRTSIQTVLNDRNVVRVKTAERLETCEEDWAIMKAMVKFLKPLNLATRVLSSDTEVTISILRPMIHSIINNHLSSDENDEYLTMTLEDLLTCSLNKRFKMEREKNDEVDIYQITSFLDHRYKNLAHECMTERIKIEKAVMQKLNTLHTTQHTAETKLTPQQTALDFIFQVQKEPQGCENQFDRYKAEPVVGHNTNISKWWKENEFRFPQIAQLAKEYLFIPCTSASSERVFSMAGNIMTKKRNCLSSENVNLLVFLFQNQALLSN